MYHFRFLEFTCKEMTPVEFILFVSKLIIRFGDSSASQTRLYVCEQNAFLLSVETAEPVLGATGFSQPDSTTVEEKKMEGEVEEEDGEPNAAELRRRRLRKLETTPPPDH